MSTPPTNRTPIAELGSGEVVKGSTYVLADPSIEVAKNGSRYLRCQLRDITGSMSAKRFDVETDTILQYEGQVLAIDGHVEEYQGSPVFRIEKAQRVDVDDVTPFVRSSDIPREVLEERLAEYLIEINSDVGRVLEEVFSDRDLWERFITAPAAQMYHHAWDGGLAEHVMSMLELADSIAQHYQRRYGPDMVDRGMVLAGVFLHDLGKVYDFERRGLTWVPTRRSVLVGHIATCVELLTLAFDACDTPEPVRERMLHLVLSHHGLKSFGSPVEPATIEARILHHVDMLDSKVASTVEALEGLEAGEVSDYLRSVRGRVVR